MTTVELDIAPTVCRYDGCTLGPEGGPAPLVQPLRGGNIREYCSDRHRIAAHRARQARIGHIHDMLANAIVGEDPPDDGIAEPGMVLTVRYDDTGDTETFLLGVRGVEDADIDVYSMQSPLGSAIVGARPGEQRTYPIPSGANLPVTLLKAVPYGMRAPKSPRRQSVPSRRTGDPRRPVATRTGSDPTPKHTATTSRLARSAT